MDAKPSTPSQPWYFKNSTLLIAFFCVGPLALPLVWFNPRFSSTKKIVITAVSLVITYFLTIYTIDAVKKIIEYYKQFSGSV